MGTTEGKSGTLYVILVKYRNTGAVTLYPTNEEADAHSAHSKDEILEQIKKNKDSGYMQHLKINATPLRIAHKQVYSNEAYEKIQELCATYNVVQTTE